jgi:prophage maintenance system killer protein
VDAKLDRVGMAIIDILKSSGRGVSSVVMLSMLESQGIKISQPTLSRRLSAMQTERYVKSQQGGRGLIHSYDGHHDWFSVEPQKRPKVPYDRQLLRSYIPNKTTWFMPGQLDKLHDAGGGSHLDASTYAHAIAQKLLVELAYASSALEGNTYSYLDTQVLIEFGQAAEGKAAFETQMILNHKEAILYLVENIHDVRIDVREIKTLHALLSRGLLADPAAVGAVRRRIVDISGSAYIPMANPHVLEEELLEIAKRAAAIDDPFEQSLFLMAFISYLQAFEDVNKRTARLACNVPLLKNGIAPLSFLDIDKANYVRGLLTFYELHQPDILRAAFVEGYLKSAHRYDAYAVRDRAILELELRRRTDIYAAVTAYVQEAVGAGERPDVRAFVEKIFSGDSDDVRKMLVNRASDIIGTLHEGNHVAYGVPRKLFDIYESTGENSRSMVPKL